MDGSMKVKLAAGAGAIVALAIALGAVGALATAHVLSSDDERVAGDRFEFRERPALRGPSDRGLFGGPPLRFPGRGVDLDDAATYLDLSESEVRDRLRDGDTLADIARDEDKSVDGLVEALVAAASERIDEQAEEEKEDLDERLTDLVNGEFAPLGFGRGCECFFPRPRR
jgi:hypothetical protein